MWIKIRSERRPLQFIRIDTMHHLFAGTYDVPTMVKDSEWDGINPDGTVRTSRKEWYEDGVPTTGVFFYDADGNYFCLVECATVREAETSLENLFLAWTKTRDHQLYLVPLGTNWITDPLLNMRGGK